MYLRVNQTNLFFDIYGSKLKIGLDNVTEKPSMIVLHGGHGFADHSLYVEFWSQFADLAQVIFLDQRGCGRSDLANSKEWNLQHWGEDVYQFCQALNIQKPIIAGVSMGGHVMGEIVRQHSDFPGGLIFCNTEAKFDLNLICEKLKQLGGAAPAEACREFYLHPNETTFANYIKQCIPYYAHNAYNQQELNRCLKQPEVFLEYCQQEILKMNYLEDMKKMKCPTLLMVGEDSCLHLVGAAKEMAERIKPEFLTMQIFSHAGAPIYKDQPKEAYEVVKDFLNKL